MLVAAVVILAGVVVVASGRGGEMAAAEPDYPPIDLGPVTSADVALLRPPSAAWGYNMRVTDEALEVIAKAVTERDVQIAALEQEVSDLRDQLGGGGRAARPDPPGGGTEPAEPPIPEPDWPGEAEATAAGPAVPITRPQPIYHVGDQSEQGDQGDPAGQGGDEVQFGPGDQSDRSDEGDQSDRDDRGDVSNFGGDASGYDAGQPETPTQTSAPWGPAEPAEQAPLWEPPQPPAAGPAISWEAPEGAAAGAAGEPAENAAREQAAEPHSGWSADPADTSPDATAVDATAEPAPDPGGATSLPVTPATGWPAQEGSVWDVASRQVDQAPEQAQAPGQAQAQAPDQAPARAGGHSNRQDFHWDEEPHQQVVWGAEHARAKAAKATEETLPNADHHDDDRD